MAPKRRASDGNAEPRTPPPGYVPRDTLRSFRSYPPGSQRQRLRPVRAPQAQHYPPVCRPPRRRQMRLAAETRRAAAAPMTELERQINARLLAAAEDFHSTGRLNLPVV
jgi:hypothetical protein